MSHLIKTAFAQLINTELTKITETCPVDHSKATGGSGLWVMFEFEDLQSVHHDEAHPNDYAVNFDYWTDELDNKESNQLINWLEKTMWNQNCKVDQLMKKYGYYPVDETDGSGGGLYYGSTLYRKL